MNRVSVLVPHMHGTGNLVPGLVLQKLNSGFGSEGRTNSGLVQCWAVLKKMR